MPVLKTNTTLSTPEMCCFPVHWQVPLLLRRLHYCPKAWGDKERVIMENANNNNMYGILYGDFYPKYFSEWWSLSPSASCFAPSAVILLLPSLKYIYHLLFILHDIDSVHIIVANVKSNKK